MVIYILYEYIFESELEIIFVPTAQHRHHVLDHQATTIDSFCTVAMNGLQNFAPAKHWKTSILVAAMQGQRFQMHIPPNPYLPSKYTRRKEWIGTNRFFSTQRQHPVSMKPEEFSSDNVLFPVSVFY
jgi:hypothetical protein